ncbi:MAG: type II secretion system F family protein [Firmicutes bacterium]|nr:type II secretion system F family protein [Bacillota bacterium]
MQNGIYVISFFVFASVTLVTLGIVSHLEADKNRVRRRLGRILASCVASEREKELAESINERVVFPVLRRVVKAIAGIAPKTVKESVRKRLEGAGNTGSMNPNEYLVLKLITGFALPLGTLLLSLACEVEVLKAIILGISGFVIGLLLPDIMIKRKKRGREKEIRKALPDVLDLLTVSVEAGLGFDSALAKVIERKKGPLSDEFGILLQEIRVGKSRREALRALAERVKIQEVSSLIAAIIQADQLGVGIANTLRIQAAQLRMSRRQQAEEAAMKAPIKMLIPLVFFIFPTIFIVLLGPAAIQIVMTFMKMGNWAQ